MRSAGGGSLPCDGVSADDMRRVVRLPLASGLPPPAVVYHAEHHRGRFSNFKQSMQSSGAELRAHAPACLMLSRLQPASGLPLPTPLRMPSSIAGCEAACMSRAAPPGDAASAAMSCAGAACNSDREIMDELRDLDTAGRCFCDSITGAPSARLSCRCLADCSAVELATAPRPLLLRH